MHMCIVVNVTITKVDVTIIKKDVIEKYSWHWLKNSHTNIVEKIWLTLMEN